MCIVFGEYSSGLLSKDFPNSGTIFAVSILVFLTFLNWLGLRAGSGTQQITSLLKTVALFAFVAACFIYGARSQPVGPASPAVTSPSGFALITAFVLAFQLVLGTYSRWFSSVYFPESGV